MPPKSRGTIAGLVESTRTGDDAWRRRALTSELPRRLRRLADDELRIEIEQEPPDAGKRWNAMIAAVVMTECAHRGLPPPAWACGPDRVLDEMWCCAESAADADEMALLPGAFLRQGVLMSPRGFDRRNSPFDDWTPKE